MNTKYSWQEPYAAALLETDWSKIEEKIQVAENGIRARLREFSVNHGGTPEENQAIEDALHGLNGLRKDVAAWQKKRAGQKGPCFSHTPKIDVPSTGVFALKHTTINWNPATKEWFCANCGRTSDHIVLEDARWELNHYEFQMGLRPTYRHEN